MGAGRVCLPNSCAACASCLAHTWRPSLYGHMPAACVCRNSCAACASRLAHTWRPSLYGHMLAACVCRILVQLVRVVWHTRGGLRCMVTCWPRVFAEILVQLVRVVWHTRGGLRCM